MGATQGNGHPPYQDGKRILAAEHASMRHGNAGAFVQSKRLEAPRLFVNQA